MPRRPKYKTYKHKPEAKTRIKGRKLHPKMEEKKWQPGQPGGGSGRPKGKTLLKAVREALQKPVSVKLPGGRRKTTTQLELAAQAYVDQMREGSFIHNKEIFDRDEGKVANVMQNPDGTPVKMYIGLPLDGEDSP